MHLLGKIKEWFLSGFMSLRNRKTLDVFVRNADSSQNAVNLFKDEWIASFPPESGVKAGNKPLYDDPRVQWMSEHVDVKDKQVLELGPMEGSHTYQLFQLGTSSVTAIESNGNSFMKCLVSKEVLNMDRATYLCADFNSWLEQNEDRFDVCFASGVLYHMTDPLKLLGLMAAHADTVYLWTHYYDEERMQKSRDHAHRFGKKVTMEWGGYSAECVHRKYGAQIWNPLHLGGEAAYSYWIKRDDLIGALKHYGLTEITIGPEDLDHPAGPAICLIAQKPD